MAYEQLISVPSSATSGQVAKANGSGGYAWSSLDYAASTHASTHEIGGTDALPTASTSTYGLAQLYDGIDSTSTTYAATANSVYLTTRIPTNPNILDNWYFLGDGSQTTGSVFPINQRGATSYVGGVYGIDRWVGVRSTITTSISNSHIVISATGSVTKDYNIWGQIVEHPEKYAGQIVTLSLMTYQSSDVDFAFNIMTTDSNSTNHWLCFSVPKNDGAGLYYDTFTLPSDITAMNIWITPDEAMASGDSIHLSAVKLEIGTVQTLAYYDISASAWKVREIPDFTTELLRCQRYQVAMNPYKVADRCLGWAMATSTTTAWAIIDLPVVIRDRPTAVSPTTWRLRYPDTNYSVTAITCYNAGHTIHMSMTSSSLTKNRMYMVRNVSASDILLLDANL